MLYTIGVVVVGVGPTTPRSWANAKTVQLALIARNWESTVLFKTPFVTNSGKTVPPPPTAYVIPST